VKLSVVTPAYNEKDTVAELVRRVRAVALPVEKEIVIVDAFTTDGTRDLIRHIEGADTRVLLQP